MQETKNGVSNTDKPMGKLLDIPVEGERDLVFPSYSDSGSRYFCPKGEPHNDQSIYAFCSIKIGNDEEESKFKTASRFDANTNSRRRINSDSREFSQQPKIFQQKTKILRAGTVPGDSTVNGAAFSGGAGRHFADALLGSTSSLLLRFLQSSVQQ